MNSRRKLFAILWIAGWAGVLSFLFVDLSGLLAALPVTAGQPLPFPPLVVKLLGIIQPTIIMSAAVFTGHLLAPKVRLSAPAAEALAEGREFLTALKPQVIPGVIGGLLGAMAILASWLLWKPFLPTLFTTRAERLNRFMPVVTRLLYGGVTEELLLRWGVMTLLLWVLWRIFQRGQDRPRTIYVVSAILLSSLLFGVGHLPIASALGVSFTLPIVSFVIFANSTFGLIAGFLYWKKGLEAAMIAHMLAHMLIVTAMYLAAR